MPQGFPRRLIIGTGTDARVYRVAGDEARTPRWQSVPVPSQEGDPLRERRVPLGDGSAGMIGSHRHFGKPSRDGVADVTNGDTSVEDRYGAGPLVSTLDLTAGLSTLHSAGSIGGSLTIGGGGDIADVSTPTYIGVSSIVHFAAAGSFNITPHASTAAGDLVVVVITALGAFSVTPPGGFIANEPSIGSDPQSGIYYSVLSSVGALTFTFAANETGTAVALTFRGQGNAPLNIIGSWGNEPSSGASTSTVAPGITTTADLCLGVAVWSLPIPSAITYTAPSGWDERIDTGTDATLNPTIMVATRALTTAGATGALTATLSTNTTTALRRNVVFAIAADYPGGAPSIGGGTTSNTPTAIWSDTSDDFGSRSRYINLVAGGRFQVVDPTTDTVAETVDWASVDGGDAAEWAGQNWIARRGGSADYVKYVTGPFDGSQTTFADSDYTAINIHAGPDAIYRAYNNFSGNTALIKKSTATTAGTVAADANWAPSSGETVADPGIAVTRLATLGEDLVIGKRDNLYEFDQTFTARTAINWMKAFLWEYNANAILPLGSAREVIVSFRRGLYYLPVNQPIGTEVLTGNETEKKGRYTAIEYDGNWVYAFLQNPETEQTSLIKMRPRRTQGPGLFEHHPIATFDGLTVAAYLWPGATVSGTTYGPRLYFGSGEDSLSYIRLGETQPDELDPNYRFTNGVWSILWPHDDFDTPATPKVPYKVEASYEGVANTTGITWSVSADHASFVDMDDDGSGSGTAPVTEDGFAQRFGPRDGSVTGRELEFRMSGTGGSTTAQQHITGTPIVTLLEQPEMVLAIDATLNLQTWPDNDANADQQWRELQAQAGGIYPMIAQYGDNVPDTTFYARLKSVREASVSASEVPGVILVQVEIRALDFT